MTEICHVTSVHTRYDTRIFHKECTSLAKAGYDVTLLVADNKPDEVRDGVKITSVDFHPKNRFDRIIHSVGAMLGRALGIDAEIYHLHDPELLPLGKKLKEHGKKVIFDSHENYPLQIANKAYLGTFAKPVAKIYKIRETYLLKNYYDAVIFPCTMFGGVNIFEGRCKRVEFISTAPKLEEFYDRYTPIDRSKLNTICYMGGLTYDRGITHLMKAAYKADAKLILGGNFKPDYLAELQTMPEFQCVDYRGYLTREQVFEVYRESAVGAAVLLDTGQYNKADNLATKVYEYMSMGMPSIVSKYPYSDKINSQYHFGITVKSGDVEELTLAIRHLLDHPQEARQMGENGRRAVQKEFNWGIEEKKLLRLYETLIP
ncbi:MAG: glycosyltransferase [Synergistes sp.]|nr:glycosyltransferase [Synergistes sp.]